MRTLVTGAAGFIGSSLVNRLLEETASDRSQQSQRRPRLPTSSRSTSRTGPVAAVAGLRRDGTAMTVQDGQ
jgi:nucleoside-diphosphate-sugar epimerase